MIQHSSNVGVILMSAKKKSHGLLFTPYLEKGEDLIWVGEPEQNPLISLYEKKDVIRLWLRYSYFLIAALMLLSPVIIANTIARYPYDLSGFISWVASLLILWLIAFFFSGYVRFGKTYYAITSQRLLILRRHFWSHLDADSLMLLPSHHLNLKDKIGNIEFEPLRVDKFEIVDRYSRRMGLREFHRSHLERLSQEEAETANELLTAVKNDMLDERARELGLME
jgi:hypothetical protein